MLSPKLAKKLQAPEPAPSPVSVTESELKTRIRKKLSAGSPEPEVQAAANPYARIGIPQLAQALGKTQFNTKRMLDYGMPEVSPGLYNLPSVVEWLIDREATERAKAGAVPVTAIGVSAQKAVQDLEIAKLKREKLALEVDDKKDNTIPREERDRDVSALIEAFTSYLRNSIQRNLATLRSVHEADADVVVNEFVQELTSHMSRAVRIK
jgi:hypothetical protein